MLFWRNCMGFYSPLNRSTEFSVDLWHSEVCFCRGHMFLLPSCKLATITLRQTWFLKWLLSKKQSTWRFTSVSLRKDARECPSYIYCFWQDWRCRSLLEHYDGPQKGLKQGKNSLHILPFPINEACPELLGTICFNIGQKKKKLHQQFHHCFSGPQNMILSHDQK